MAEIKMVHAHFLITTGSYCNERIGFSVELHEGESVEDVVESLRQKAINIVGATASELYSVRYKLKAECTQLGERLTRLQDEWNRTADFLQAQGINPQAPKLTPVSGLLSASKIEEESVLEGELEDHPS